MQTGSTSTRFTIQVACLSPRFRRWLRFLGTSGDVTTSTASPLRREALRSAATIPPLKFAPSPHADAVRRRRRLVETSRNVGTYPLRRPRRWAMRERMAPDWRKTSRAVRRRVRSSGSIAEAGNCLTRRWTSTTPACSSGRRTNLEGIAALRALNKRGVRAYCAHGRRPVLPIR
jgi:hypothetical protein